MKRLRSSSGRAPASVEKRVGRQFKVRVPDYDDFIDQIAAAFRVPRDLLGLTPHSAGVRVDRVITGYKENK